VTEERRAVGGGEQQREHVRRAQHAEVAVARRRLPERRDPVRARRTAGRHERRGVAGVQHPADRRRRVVAGHGHDRPVGEVEQPRQAGVEGFQHVPLGVRRLGVPGLVGRLSVHVHERRPGVEQVGAGGDAGRHVRREVGIGRHVAGIQPEQGGEPTIEAAARHRAARKADHLLERRQRRPDARPLGGEQVERRQAAPGPVGVDRRAAQRHPGGEQERHKVCCQRLALGRTGGRAQPRVQVLEERVGVADVAGCVRRKQEQRLAGPTQRAHLDPVPRGDGGQRVEQRRRVVGVGPRRPPGHPHHVPIANRGPQRPVQRRHAVPHVDARAHPLEHGAPGEGQVVVPQQRPVAHLRRRRPAPAERHVPSTRPAAGQLVQHRGAGRLGRGLAAQLGHRAVAEPVEHDEQDGQAGVEGPRLRLAVPGRSGGHHAVPARAASSARSSATVAGGTSASQLSPRRSAARTSLALRRLAGSPGTSTTW
jgi:hypothetical protein